MIGRKSVSQPGAPHRMAWICLLLACLGASWFLYQCLLVPQPARFAPHWADARWIQAEDGRFPVAYFRHATSLNAIPDAAFVTVAASQIFSLYVNGVLIGSNASDFSQGNFPRACIYDVLALLKPGSNVIAVRVSNADEQPPSLRLSFGMVRGSLVDYSGSDAGWQATEQSALVYPLFSKNRQSWSSSSFEANSWPPARPGPAPRIEPLLTVNPLLYEKPLATEWISAGAGQDAYFVRRFALPAGATSVWLRLAVTGAADVFVNGDLIIENSPPPASGKGGSPGNSAVTQTRQQSIAAQLYNVSPYLHAGMNTIALHMQTPGGGAARAGTDQVYGAVALDLLTSDAMNHAAWLPFDTGWHASLRPVAGWNGGNDAALRWPPPLPVARPATSSLASSPSNVTSAGAQVIPFALIIAVILLGSGAVLTLWLVMALCVVRRYGRPVRVALETMSLAYLPALACEALLILLAREPLRQQPFPYTWFWGLALSMVVAGSYLLLWHNMVIRQERQGPAPVLHRDAQPSLKIRPRTILNERIRVWLSRHWPLLPLLLLAIPLICYNLAYEPYWQDELSSYYAALGVLSHGLPFFPSGFLYEKAEFYSYVLALWIRLCGDQGGVLRFISALEYLACIPLLYGVGCAFFDRRIALLAAAMLTFSPAALLWGREMRMYQQAQMLTLLVVYIFYIALKRRRSRYVYLAMLCLALDYLSHEETFIILPALLLCALLMSRNARLRLPAVLYEKRWWCAAIAAGCVIAIQLLLVRVTHPPVLGSDSSQRPFIQFTTDNIPYYIGVLFFPPGTAPWLTLNSLLATAGCILARRNTNMAAQYCALFLVASCVTLVLTFTMRADRYIYPVLPLYYLMGSYALWNILRSFWTFAHPLVVSPARPYRTKAVADGGYPSPPLSMRMSAIAIVGILCTAVLIAPVLPLANYNLFISRITGIPYHRHYPDYDAVGQYMHQHWRKGDIVIAVAPESSVLYYVGHVDYFFSVNRALFLLERDGHIIDTSVGARALLDQSDFDAVLAAHARVWIISDAGTYQAQVARRFVFPADFHVVFEGFASAVYFRGG
jgi:4-amino-4-deoxy-L-arabinose transferase-like glycosyltransferase